MIGKTISHYKILSKLGEGGMGVVYKARDTKLDRDVALKFLPHDLIRDREAVERFRREAKAAAALNHPNIVTIYEIGEHEESAQADRQLYIVMEFVDGLTLREKIRDERIKIKDAIEYAIQIAEALKIAHKKGIVHRDIKPENILVDGSGRVRILDFGLAKLKGAGKLTGERSTLGTVHYMSPEQIRGEEVDHQTDIWSLGVVLYEMLTGDVPFKGDYEQAVIYSILNEEAVSPGKLREDIPENLVPVVMKLIHKDKGHRYLTSDDFLSHLKIPGSTPVRRQPGSRYRFLLVGLSGVVVLIFGFIIYKLFHGDLIGRDLKRKMLAVLPFENLGAEDDAYFVDGMTEAVTARLAQLQGLGVISRQSTIQYRGSTQQTGEIGKELGVDYLLLGTIQRERRSDPLSHIRMIPQLVSVSEDIQIWTKTFDSEMKEVFTVQSEIAEKVAEALDIHLLRSDREIGRRRSTDNLEAYELYLHGLDYLNRGWAENDLRYAEKMFAEATALDTTFALAFAMLSRVHCSLYREYYDRTSERLEEARATAEKALAFDKNLAEANLSLGYYYYVAKRLDDALKEYETVRLGQPSNADVHSAIAYVYRIQGDLDKAILMLERAVELDPYNHLKVYELAMTCLFGHRYADAEHAFDRVIAQVPDLFLSYLYKSTLYMSWHGDSLKARKTMHQAAEIIGFKELVSRLVFVGGSGVFKYLDKPFLDALENLTLTESSGDSSSYYSAKSVLYDRRGRPELENAYLDSSRAVLERLIYSGADDAYFRAELGVAYAKLGRKEEALREIDLALTMMPVTEDVWTGTDFLWLLIEVYITLGEYEKAIDEIERALEYPGIMSKAWIRVDKLYEPLYEYPRFQKLVTESE